jgi:6-pyruvoyltetrahydropterin/6-carboxytetrahydropterin synthase
MTNATIVKTFTFDAAHKLPNHDGKCRRLHGHTYRVEVVLTGPINSTAGESSEGMVRDFADVTDVWKRELEPWLDHQYLNDTIGNDMDRYTVGREWVPRCWPTTAENIALWLLRAFRAHIPEVEAIRVWETPTSHAIVTTLSLA